MKADTDPKESHEIKGKTTSDSLLRIAEKLRSRSGAGGSADLARLADVFEEEAKLLSPSHEVIATKEELEKELVASRAAADKAAAVLANPAATSREHADALKELKK